MSDDHRLSKSNALTINLNTVLCKNGFANNLPTTFLLDSRAAISVVRFGSLSNKDHRTIIKTECSPVSANGTPLDVKGQIN